MYLSENQSGDLDDVGWKRLWRRRNRRVLWLTARVCAACVLLAAASLKAYDLATSLVVEASWIESRVFLVAVVEYELLLGLWLLSGWRPRLAHHVTLITFCLFALAALIKVVAGDASCGCFGKLSVDPRVTLGLDVAMILLLTVAFAPQATRPESGATEFRVKGAWVFGFLAVAIGLPSAWWMSHYEPAVFDESGILIGDDPFVVLEPEAWIDKHLPILPHIDIGASLSEGTWLMILYRHDCSHCVESLASLSDDAVRLTTTGGYRGIAVIELPPFAPSGADPITPSSPFHRGRLSPSREWFVQTPAAMDLADGIVVALRTDLVE